MQEISFEYAYLLKLISSVERPVKSGDWLFVYCQSHPDGSKHKRGGAGLAGRSLGLSNRGVLECFGGCRSSDIVRILQERTGIMPDDDGAGSPTRQRPWPQKPVSEGSNPSQPTIIYEFRDAAGKLFAEKARFDRQDGTKSFAWRLPGEQKWGGVSLDNSPLFGAELLNTWPLDDEWVVFTEGEKATLACRAAGLRAVSHGGGSSAPDGQLMHALDDLMGRNVAIWPDNDPVGRKYAARVAKHLRNVAKNIRFITVPLPSKGDAYEYFNGWTDLSTGEVHDPGLASDIYKTQWTSPVVKNIAKDHIEVVVPTDMGPVSFDFVDMIHVGAGTRTELGCEVTAKIVYGGFEPYAGLRANLLSSSFRNQFRLFLEQHFGKGANWATAISVAFREAQVAFVNQQRSTKLADLQRPTGISWIVEDIIPSGQPVCLFGPPEGGKSLFSDCLIVSVASGIPFLGKNVVEKGPVLYVDFETDGDEGKEFTARIHGIGQGLGLDEDEVKALPIHYWPGGGVPIVEQVQALRQFVDENDIVLMVVDSVGPALGGDPRESFIVTSFFNTLKRISTTCVLIAQQSKDDIRHQRDDFPFESIQWHYQSRRTFHVASAPQPQGVVLCVRNRKHNGTAGMPPLTYAVDFDSHGAINVRPENLLNVPALESFLPSTIRIWRILDREGAMLWVDIMGRLGWQGKEAGERLSRNLRWLMQQQHVETAEDSTKRRVYRAIGNGPTAP